MRLPLRLTVTLFRNRGESRERALISAVIQRAFFDLAEEVREKNPSFDWIMAIGGHQGETVDEVFSFEWCCQHIEMNLKEARKVALELKNKPNAYIRKVLGNMKITQETRPIRSKV